jgi:hypothetical protein
MGSNHDFTITRYSHAVARLLNTDHRLAFAQNRQAVDNFDAVDEARLNMLARTREYASVPHHLVASMQILPRVISKLVTLRCNRTLANGLCDEVDALRYFIGHRG